MKVYPMKMLMWHNTFVYAKYDNIQKHEYRECATDSFGLVIKISHPFALNTVR